MFAEESSRRRRTVGGTLRDAAADTDNAIPADSSTGCGQEKGDVGSRKQNFPAFQSVDEVIQLPTYEVMSRNRHENKNELVVYRRRKGYSQKQVATILGHGGTSMLSRLEPTASHLAAGRSTGPRHGHLTAPRSFLGGPARRAAVPLLGHKQMERLHGEPVNRLPSRI